MSKNQLASCKPQSQKPRWGILFRLPNGEALRYTLPGDSEIPWRTADTNRALSWERPVKNLNLNIHGWVKGSNQNVIFLDFDHISENDFHSFDALYQYCSIFFRGRGLTFRSHSKHVKVAVVVETPEGCPMTKAIARDTAQAILEDDLFNYVDKSGFETSFSNRKVTKLFYKKLSKLKPIPAILDSVDLDSLVDQDIDFSDGDYAAIEEESGHRSLGNGDLYTHRHEAYEMYEGEVDQRLNISNNIRIIKLMKFLMKTQSLTKGFNISQLKLGNTIGVHQRTAGRYLKQLVKIGFLEMIDDTVMQGRKAMTYRAAGPVMEVLSELYKPKPKPLLPTTIPGHRWNATFAAVIFRHFWNRPDAFLDWVKSIPGWDRKDRWKQAQRFAKSLKKAGKLAASPKKPLAPH